jgi:hypothetical protein
MVRLSSRLRFKERRGGTMFSLELIKRAKVFLKLINGGQTELLVCSKCNYLDPISHTILAYILLKVES